jgi:surfeit locus 1 family protein
VQAPASIEQAPPLEFHPGVADGVFLNDKEIFLGATSPRGGSPGFQVLTPLRQAGGRIIFVNRGFVPSALKDPQKRSRGQLAGTVHVSGLLRLPKGKPGWIVPENRPDLNYWFWIDLPAMAAATGISNVAPFYIDADATPNPGGWPKGGITPIELPNDHLQYAITWFLLAAAAVAVYAVWQRQAGGRRGPGRPR